MSRPLPLIAVTPGEPAGIGPDIAVQLLARELPARVVFVADPALLRERARLLGAEVDLPLFESPSATDRFSVQPVPLCRPATPGRPDIANASYVLDTLRLAAGGCLRGPFQALVTGPVHKGVINDASIPFTGHTEFLADLTRAPQVVMMLVGGGMRVALATTHLPLRAVPDFLNREGLERVLRVLHDDLVRKFALPNPRILVAGLNPHAGESGHLGKEEIDVIEPVLHALRAAGMHLEGPLPADTLFQPERLSRCDAVLAMYHDQGLPVLKHASFGTGINVTLGLPLIRTSVDHGTALDLAGTGQARPDSLIEAITLAADLALRAG
jgi:4-hydroxythreonine-4-phosphate dehydrogenase